jgi:hypothetical protein
LSAEHPKQIRAETEKWFHPECITGWDAGSAWLTLEFYRRRAFEKDVRVWRCLWRAFDKNRLKVAAGGCGGRGLTADPNLMAMGIESFFLSTLLILLGRFLPAI